MDTIISIPPIPAAETPVVEEDPDSGRGNHFVRLLGTRELVFLEIQGAIARLDERESRLGRLVQQEDGRIYLLVGYQKMEGKVVTLKTPFAVLRRKKGPAKTDMAAGGEEGTEMDVDGTQEEESSGGVVEMEVVDVCRKKIYFGNRPEPMNEMEAAAVSDDRENVAT